jgi:hypothetical protein
MKTWLYAVILIWPLSGLSAIERAVPPADATSQLVRDLDDDNYFVRERALEKLAEVGLPALPALGQALLDGSPEAVWRASAALEHIAIEGDEKQLQQVSDLLKKLSAKKPGLARIANELAVRQQWARHETAVGQLRSLGGRVFTMEGEIAGEFGFVDVGGLEVLVDADVEMPAMEEEVELAEEPGIFGAIRAIARVLIPGIEDPEAPPEPIVPEAEAMPDDAPVAESPDVEIIGRALPRPVDADVEIIEEAGPAIDPTDIDVALAEVGMEELGLDGAVNGVSQIALTKTWLGGDAGLAHLKHVKGLATVTVEDARLSDAALPHLEAVPTLRQLTLRGGAFTTAGLRKWREKRPDVQIWAFGPAMMGVGADMGSKPLVLNHIYPRSGAHEAGLAAGDIVKQIDGEEIRDFADLMLCVFQRKVGDKLRVDFERDGKARTVEVSLKARQVVEGAAVEEDPFR